MNIFSSISAWFSSAFSNMNVNPQNFIDNMYYMGMGMLSIFIVIVVIIIITFLINKLTTLKKKNNQQ